MGEVRSNADQADQSSSGEGGPLSLKRLTAAFAQMLGTPASGATADDEPAGRGPKLHDPCEISPRSIVEAVLFVGAAEGEPRTAGELAAAMRDVTPGEVEQAIAELNAIYEQDAAPYHIEQHEGGYRLTLREELSRVRDRFHGRVKESKLSAAAMEVLSVVAYKQPVTGKRVDQMRGARSGPLLASLVRRGLVRLDRSEPGTPAPAYHTTDRFLRLFGLADANQLPRVAELGD